MHAKLSHSPSLINSLTTNSNWMVNLFLDVLVCISIAYCFVAAINSPCSKFWLRFGENDVIFSKIPPGLKL